jgi:hypothetical protein
MSSPPLPPVSANSLFHFTGSLENLLNILTNEFRPRFCLENFGLLKEHAVSAVKDEDLEWAIPMVCFCDLPLSQTGFHLSVYGDYGIGLTKDWGKRNGIAPVLYAYSQSILTTKLANMLAALASEETANALASELMQDFFDVFSFVKPYEGNLWREGRVVSNLRFYNEREWRFVPRLSKGDSYREGMNKADFLDDSKRTEANKKVAELSRISFEPNDIKYLIVRREEEIVPLIKEVETIKGRYSYDDVRLLFSRVISAEQIRNDF